MDHVRSGAIGIKITRLWLSFVVFLVVLGLVACATESQPAIIAAPSPTTRSIVLTTEAAFTSVPTRSTATQIPATPNIVADTPTATFSPTAVAIYTPTATASPTATRWSTDPHPLQIEVMRQQSYPGSEITFEQTLKPEPNYNKYVVSYQSDGYRIFALMTVPNGVKPDTGWPVIIFNHGYVRPSEYGTTLNYVPYIVVHRSK